MSEPASDVGEALDLAPDTASVAAARRFVARTFAGRVPRDVIADLVLATSELVTNAIEHGPPVTPPAKVRVSAQVADAWAAIVVRSAGDAAIGDPDGWDLPAADVRTGRGLGIVRQVADQVAVRRIGGALEITARRAW